MDDDRFDPLSDDERERGGPAGGSAKDDDDWELISPIPDLVPAPSMRHSILGNPVAVWIYRDANGGKVCTSLATTRPTVRRNFGLGHGENTARLESGSGAGGTFPIRVRSTGSNCSPNALALR